MIIITTLYSSSIKDLTACKISHLDGQAYSHNLFLYLHLSKSAQTKMYLATLDLLQEVRVFVWRKKKLKKSHNAP